MIVAGASANFTKIAEVDKNTRYYYGSQEALEQYASWQPEYEKE